jgi:putative transposase
MWNRLGLACDGWSHDQSPFGRGKTGPNPTNRGKCGVKRSMLTEGHGVPIGVVVEGANRHDMKLVQPSIESLVLCQCSFDKWHLFVKPR